MSTLTLEIVNTIYQCAANLRIKRYRVDYSGLEQFCSRYYYFKSSVGVQAEDPYWQSFLKPLGYLRFDLCAVPFTVESKSSLIHALYSDLLNHLKNCALIYPSLSKPAFQLLESLVNLCSGTTNPLLEKLVDLSRGKRRVAWVVKESRLIAQADMVIAANQEILRSVEAIHFSQIFSKTIYDQVIVIGSPRWFPSSLFMSPRTSEMSVIQYSWIQDKWEPPKTFIAQYNPSGSLRNKFIDDNYTARSEISAESLLPSPDDRAIIAYAKQREHEEYEEIEARCVIFEGGQAMFVESGESASVHIIDVDELESGEEEDRVRNVPTRHLHPGVFILVRTGGGGDYIVPIADDLMGPYAKVARQRQSHWKQLLKQRVVARGLLQTSIDLINLGSNIAEEQNVRNWMFPRNIKTRDKRDFLAIMRLVGLENQADEYWHTMEIINRAHHKAGFQLSRLLLAQIREISPDEFRRSGRVELKLSGSDEEAGLIAFRIESILPQKYTVPYTQIGIIFKLDK